MIKGPLNFIIFDILIGDGWVAMTLAQLIKLGKCGVEMGGGRGVGYW